MVCDRCKSTIQNEIEKLEIQVYSIELGEVVIDKIEENVLNKIEKSIIKHGFLLVKEESDLLIEKVKTILINRLDKEEDTNKGIRSLNFFLGPCLRRKFIIYFYFNIIIKRFYASFFYIFKSFLYSFF